MKNAFIAFVAIGMFLVLAGQAQAAGDSEFAQGVTLFKQENYRSALEQFVAARDKGMDAPKLDYNMGVCYYKLGQYTSARQSFMRAAGHPPMRDLAHYNIGLVAEAQNQTAEATGWFRRVHDETDSPTLKELSASKLGLVEEPHSGGRRKGASWFGGYSADVGYDDNIEDPVQNGVTGKGDSFAELLLYASGLVQGTHENGIRLGGDAYFLRHQDITRYDISLYQVRLDKTFTAGSWQDKAGVDVEQIALGSNDYLRSVRFSIAGLKPLSDTDSLRLRYRYSNITSLDTLYDQLEGHRQEAEVRWQRKTVKRRVQALYEFEANDRADLVSGSTFTSYSPTRHTLELKAGVRPNSGWYPEGRLSLRHSRYNDANILAGGGSVTREDDRALVGVKLARKLYRSLALDLEYKYTDNNSNITTYDYTRNLYSIGLSGSF